MKWFKHDESALSLIKKIWFNSGRLIKETFEKDAKSEYDNSLEIKIKKSKNTSIGQGVKFEDEIEQIEGLWDRKLFRSGDSLSFFGLDFLFLSPNSEKLKLLLRKWDKEDKIGLKTSTTNDYAALLQAHVDADNDYVEDNAVHNGSSIAFIMTYSGRNFLFLADAHPSVVREALTVLGYSEEFPIVCELVKVSHHGSKSNNDQALIKLIDSKKFIISTNGDKHSHPHKRFLARLINLKPDCEIYFNYPEQIDQIFKPSDREQFTGFKAFGLKGHQFTY